MNQYRNISLFIVGCLVVMNTSVLFSYKADLADQIKRQQQYVLQLKINLSNSEQQMNAISDKNSSPYRVAKNKYNDALTKFNEAQLQLERLINEETMKKR